VENVDQLRQLERFGCDQIQGYYIGRPLPAHECVTQLQQLQRAPAPA
jgi:EAL domain-containing protein (putative c-di-GMP-specific phosphodiesterase class I)